MAKLNAPLFSFKATGAIAKALVYDVWKGINVVRSYAVPSNPRTALQVTQRGYFTLAVAGAHTAMSDATHPLKEIDKVAYAELARTRRTPRTWFNEIVKIWVDQLIASKTGSIHCDGSFTPAANQITTDCWESGDTSTAGDWWYGTSPTALLSSQADVPAGQQHTCVIAGLTTGVKYFMQFRSTAPAGTIGADSGIYHAYAG